MLTKYYLVAENEFYTACFASPRVAEASETLLLLVPGPEEASWNQPKDSDSPCFTTHN